MGFLVCYLGFWTNYPINSANTLYTDLFVSMGTKRVKSRFYLCQLIHSATVKLCYAEEVYKELPISSHLSKDDERLGKKEDLRSPSGSVAAH